MSSKYQWGAAEVLAFQSKTPTLFSYGMKIAFEHIMMKIIVVAGLSKHTCEPGLSMGCRSLRSAFGVFFCLVFLNVSAGNHYISASGSGSKNGTDWNNAWAGTAASYVRGDTYYFSTGTYGALTLSTSGSGSNTITLKAATVADHGTNTGWSDSLAGQAVFVGQTSINSPYWTIDGQTRGSDWRSGYGLKFWNQTSATGAAVMLNSGANNITLRYVELEGTAGNVQQSGAEDYGISENNTSINSLYIGYCYLHDTGNSQVQLNYANGDGLLIEYSFIYRNHCNNNAQHDEAVASSMSDMTIRYNIFGDIMWTAFIANATGYSGNMANWEIYGNVFFWDSAFQNSSSAFVGNGIVGLPSNVSGNALTGSYKFYNNTIVGIKSTTGNDHNAFMDVSVSTTMNCENNLWYDCDEFAMVHGSGNKVVDYNSYYGHNNTIDTGTHSTYNSTLPTLFVNSGGNDYHLTGATAEGLSLSSPYNIDIDGSIRGADGSWDRGAYEYNSQSNKEPVISNIDTAPLSTNSVTITWTTDENANSIVDYGPTASYGASITNAAMVTAHSVTITNLNAQINNYFQVRSIDSSNQMNSSVSKTLSPSVTGLHVMSTP